MKCVLTLLILLVVHFSNGQAIKFQFKRITLCNTAGTIDSSWYFLTDDNDSTYNSQDGSALLPKPGNYRLTMLSEPEAKFPVIEITNLDTYTYTYYEPKIAVRALSMHFYIVYVTCGKPLEGYHEDFHNNGKIRIRGNFEKGKPKDSLVTFYFNGVPKKRIIYLPEEILIKEYDSLGHLLLVSHNNNQSQYLTDYRTFEFFPDGTIKLKETRKNRLVLIEEYYHGGKFKTLQTNKYRVECYKNGKINVHYTWKRKRSRTLKGEYRFEFKINKTVYDFDGNKVEHIVYEKWRMLDPQPLLQVQKSDWINLWTKYVNGKEVLVAKSIATDEYFQTNANN